MIFKHYVFGSDMIKEVIIWPKSNFCVVVYNNLLRGFPPWILLYFVWPTYAWLVSNVVVHNGKQVIKAKKVVVLFLLLLSTKCKKVETKGVPRVRGLDLQKSLCCRSLVRSHRVGLESFQVGSFDLLGTVARKQQLPLGKAPHNATFMKEIRWYFWSIIMISSNLLPLWERTPFRAPLLSIHFMRTFLSNWLAFSSCCILVFSSIFFNFSWGNKVKHQSHNCSNCVAGTSTCTTIAFTINEKGTLGTTNWTYSITLLLYNLQNLRILWDTQPIKLFWLVKTFCWLAKWAVIRNQIFTGDGRKTT